MIGDDIEITVVDIRGDKVRLGITAPNTIPVHRKEVYEAIQRENREAAAIRMEDLPGGQVRAQHTPVTRVPMRPGRSIVPGAHPPIIASASETPPTPPLPPGSSSTSTPPTA